jgi:hypothetical protein
VVEAKLRVGGEVIPACFQNWTSNKTTTGPRYPFSAVILSMRLNASLRS